MIYFSLSSVVPLCHHIKKMTAYLDKALRTSGVEDLTPVRDQNGHILIMNLILEIFSTSAYID